MYKASKLKNNSGFSLIELMVVVAIIGILATIAIPKVSKFMAKARQTEVKGNLAAIYTANKAFFVEYNAYHTVFQVIGYSPEGDLRYNLGFGEPRTSIPSGYTADNVDGQSVACGASGYCNSADRCTCLAEATGAGDLADTTTAEDTFFLAGGAGNVVQGNPSDIWTIDQNKRVRQTQNGIDSAPVATE